MENWRVEQTAAGISLAEEKFLSGIFLGDMLSPLLFVIVMMPLSHLLKKCTGGYNLHESQEKFNHLMYVDDTKLFSKDMKYLETLIQAERIYGQDRGMIFVIEKYTISSNSSTKQCHLVYVKARIDKT